MVVAVVAGRIEAVGMGIGADAGHLDAGEKESGLGKEPMVGGPEVDVMAFCH